jgi:hypothetical protein
MNQYRCDETCNKKGTERCPIEFSTVEREAERVSETCGLVCHSDFQSERDKVLEKFWISIISDRELPKIIPNYYSVVLDRILKIKEELRAGVR